MMRQKIPKIWSRDRAYKEAMDYASLIENPNKNRKLVYETEVMTMRVA